MTLIAGLFVTSCHDKMDSGYTPENVQKTMQFEAAFKETFTSKIDPNQDWGFTPAYLTKASTRVADPRSNMWADLGYTIPTAITPTEKQKVVNYFSIKGAESYTSLINWDEFFVQQVYKGTAKYKAGNEGEVTGGNQMDWLCAGSASMGDDHVNNFNNADGSVMLMVKSSTQRFGFKSSSDNGHVFHNFRMVNGADIDPSLAGFYYVGLDFEAAGQNPNEQISRDLIYNDWIVKILPSKGVTNNDQPSTAFTENTRTTKTEYFKKRYLMDYGRVFCEDLGGNYNLREDFDYNDVVFDAKLWKEEEWQKVTITTMKVITTNTTYYVKDSGGNVVLENGQPKTYVETTTETIPTEEILEPTRVEGAEPAFYAEICLLATGATLPVRVGGQDAIEVHKAFGDFSVDCMINTFDEYTATVKNGFGYHEVAEPVTLDWIDVTSYYKNKTEYSISDIPVYVRWQGTKATAVQAVKGSAPERFTIREKINWASERANMNVGYPAFTSWVETSSPFWSGVSQSATGLYQGYPSPTAGLTFDDSDVSPAEHILAVHYTKYDIENIDGETVEVDEGGNVISGDNNVNNDNNNNNNNNNNSTVTTLWTGEKEYKEWSGADKNHYNLADATFEANNTIRIYYTGTYFWSEAGFTMEVFANDGYDWGTEMYKSNGKNVMKSNSYIDIVIPSQAVQNLNNIKILGIGAESCKITKIELRK